MLGHEELSKAAILVFANKQVQFNTPEYKNLLIGRRAKLEKIDSASSPGREGVHVGGGDLEAAEPAVHPETQVADPVLLRPHRRRVS